MRIKKVLVVDDSPTDLTHIQSIVADAGCMVLTASAVRKHLTRPGPTSRIDLPRHYHAGSRRLWHLSQADER